MTLNQDTTFAVMGLCHAIDLRRIASTDFGSVENQASKNLSQQASVTDGVRRFVEWHRSYHA